MNGLKRNLPIKIFKLKLFEKFSFHVEHTRYDILRIKPLYYTCIYNEVQVGGIMLCNKQIIGLKYLNLYLTRNLCQLCTT